MRMLRSLMVCLGVIASGISASGQTGSQEAKSAELPPLPDGILLRKPENFSKWQIVYDYAEGNKKAQPNAGASTKLRRGQIVVAPLGRVVLTFTKPIWHAAVVDIDGQKLDEWGDPNGQFIAGAYLPAPMEVPILYSKPMVPNFGACGFPDLDWVSAKTYVGVEALGGLRCLVFRQGQMTAWVDWETRYPVRWQLGKENRGFKQLPPPEAMLTMPKEIDGLSKASKHDKELLSRPIPIGG